MNEREALVYSRVAANLSHAAARSLAAGVDLDLQCGGKSAFSELADALDAGLVRERAVDAAARRVLMEKCVRAAGRPLACSLRGGRRVFVGRV